MLQDEKRKKLQKISSWKRTELKGSYFIAIYVKERGKKIQKLIFLFKGIQETEVIF